MKLKKYTFDIKLNAVVSIKAKSQADARTEIDAIMSALVIDRNQVVGANVDTVNEAFNDISATMQGECNHGDTGGGICLDCGHDTCGAREDYPDCTAPNCEHE